MFKWLISNYEIVITGISLIISLLCWVIKKRSAIWEKIRVACQNAIEDAETLVGATGEQKKSFVIAKLLAITKKFKIEKLSQLIDTMVALTKNVNVKK